MQFFAGKPNILLLYPNEGHILNNPEAQKDLTARTKDWFDHYLKDKPLAYPNASLKDFAQRSGGNR